MGLAELERSFELLERVSEVTQKKGPGVYESMGLKKFAGPRLRLSIDL